MLHPANRLLAWCVLTVSLAKAPFTLLCILALISVLAALWLVPQAFKHSIHRMRWLLLTLIGIFAWSTPGVYVVSSWYAPSVDGIYAGIQQAFRLLATVSGLQIALCDMSQKMLLSACYQLSCPLAWLGVDRLRFTVRLGLTLQYAEQWLNEKSRISWRTLSAAFENRVQETLPTGAVIEVLPFSRADAWINLGLCIVLLMISMVR